MIPKLVSFAFIALACTLTGCSSLKPVSPTSVTLNFPPLGEVSEKELGDTLIDKGVLKSYEAIAVTEPLTGNWGLGGKMQAEPGNFVVIATSREGTIYSAPAPVHWSALLGSGFGNGGIVIPVNPTNKPFLYVNIGSETKRSTLKDFHFEKTVAQELLPGSFRQELIYNGKSGNNIKFLYRESKDAHLLSPLTQEVTYDLNESDLIGFKGARVKVIEASNTRIKYSVVQTFE